MDKILVCLLLTSAMGVLSLPALAQDMPGAVAEMYDTEGNRVGIIELTTVEDGVQIQTQLEGFDAAVTGGERGEHGFHIHEKGDCSAPDFSSAGGHFNPTGVGHGLLDTDGPHAGDLPNLWIEADGSADYTLTTDLVSLTPGERSVFDEDGSSFVIHAGPDDYLTDPAGDSGGRIACGVIVQNE
jgi:superoxide dismutase, Cu-Zn family